MKERLLAFICCPECKKGLDIECVEEERNEIKKGILKCRSCNNVFPIIDYVPRFVMSDEYVKNFSFEWQTHTETQLDSITGRPESENEFRRKTGFDFKSFREKLFLDVGCGTGRYSEVVLKHGGEVIGIDLSYSIDVAQKNVGAFPKAHLIQADIFNLPFKEGVFDYIFSIGVLHHTPDTKKAFLGLVPHLRRGGMIAIWVYSKCLFQHYPTDKYRKVSVRLPKRLLYYLSYSAVVLYYLKKIPLLGGFFETYLYCSMHPDWKWRVLDTFDWYSPRYQFKHTCWEVMNWFKDAGLRDMELLDFPVAVKGKMPDEKD